MSDPMDDAKQIAKEYMDRLSERRALFTYVKGETSAQRRRRWDTIAKEWRRKQDAPLLALTKAIWSIRSGSGPLRDSMLKELVFEGLMEWQCGSARGFSMWQHGATHGFRVESHELKAVASAVLGQYGDNSTEYSRYAMAFLKEAALSRVLHGHGGGECVCFRCAPWFAESRHEERERIREIQDHAYLSAAE